jgi:hypothetical protein
VVADEPDELTTLRPSGGTTGVRGGQPGNSNAAKHHLHTVNRERKLLITRALDGRTDEGRYVASKRADLVADLGGEDNLSTQERALVDETVFLMLQLGHINAWLAKQTTLVNRRTKALHPVVRERTALVGTLRALLGDLGLKRRAKDVQTLESYLAARTNTAGASPSGAPAAAVDPPSPAAAAAPPNGDVMAGRQGTP